ncbi:MAG: metal ABC transporter permease, partial [Planctomycetota bacterium]
SSVKLVGVFTVFTFLVIPPLTSLLIFSNFWSSLIFSYILGFISVIVSILAVDISTTPLITFILSSMFFATFIIKKVRKNLHKI